MAPCGQGMPSVTGSPLRFSGVAAETSILTEGIARLTHVDAGEVRLRYVTDFASHRLLVSISSH